MFIRIFGNYLEIVRQHNITRWYTEEKKLYDGISENKVNSFKTDVYT